MTAVRAVTATTVRTGVLGPSAEEATGAIVAGAPGVTAVVVTTENAAAAMTPRRNTDPSTKKRGPAPGKSRPRALLRSFTDCSRPPAARPPPEPGQLPGRPHTAPAATGAGHARCRARNHHATCRGSRARPRPPARRAQRPPVRFPGQPVVGGTGAVRHRAFRTRPVPVVAVDVSGPAQQP